MNTPVTLPALNAPDPRRPLGLMLAAIVLALITCLCLLMAASEIFSALVIRTPQIAQTPAIAAVQIGMSVVFLGIACFCAFTVVGLFRLKRWARYSILTLGSLLVLFSTLFGAFFLIFAFSSSLARANPAGTPGVPPTAMKAVFLSMGAFFLLGSLLGVWWLVYFNLRPIRALFASGSMPGTPQLFTDTPASQVQVPVVSVLPGRSVTEVLLICLGIVYIVGAVCGVITALLQIPLFFLGFIVRGVSASFLSIAILTINLGLGIGILRRLRLAWMVALAFNVFGFFYALLFFIPGYRASFASYQQEIVRHMFAGTALALPPNAYVPGSGTYVLSGVGGLLFVGAVFWLLLRARPLFQIRP